MVFNGAGTGVRALALVTDPRETVSYLHMS